MLSEVPLPELQEGDGDLIDGLPISLRLGEPVRCHGDEWKSFWMLPDGEPWLLIAETSDGFLLKFPDIMICSVNSASLSIVCAPLNNSPDVTIRHLVLDQVVPLLLSWRGLVILHVAVVKVGDIGIGFMGVSGRGKSTLTAEFSRCGHEVISDDSVLLERSNGQYRAVANYPGIRLWDDSYQGVFRESEEFAVPMAHYTEKKRIQSKGVMSGSSNAAPLAYLFSLEDELKDSPDVVCISAMGFQEKLKLLLESKFRLDITDAQVLSQEFSMLSRLVEEIDCYKMHYRREYSMVGEVRKKICDFVEYEIGA